MIANTHGTPQKYLQKEVTYQLSGTRAGSRGSKRLNHEGKAIPNVTKNQLTAPKVPDISVGAISETKAGQQLQNPPAPSPITNLPIVIKIILSIMQIAVPILIIMLMIKIILRFPYLANQPPAVELIIPPSSSTLVKRVDQVDPPFLKPYFTAKVSLKVLYEAIAKPNWSIPRDIVMAKPQTQHFLITFPDPSLISSSFSSCCSLLVSFGKVAIEGLISSLTSSDLQTSQRFSCVSGVSYILL